MVVEQKTNGFRSEIKKRPDHKKQSNIQTVLRIRHSWVRSFFEKATLKNKKFPFLRPENQTSTTQTETEQGINKPADIHFSK